MVLQKTIVWNLYDHAKLARFKKFIYYLKLTLLIKEMATNPKVQCHRAYIII
jgi:hypothetical protein